MQMWLNIIAMLHLTPREARGAQVQELGANAWRLTVPAGPAGHYRLAQLDDYTSKPRRAFPWHAPLRFSLSARVSATDLPGTWGFGLWNDPFSLSFGLGGMAQRFPALPETAWFFFASPPNYLSFVDHLPAQGFLAATFRSAGLPAWLLAPGALAAPFFLLPGVSRLLRRLLRRLIRQDTALLSIDPTEWHHYEIDWQAQQVRFYVDDVPVLETAVAPRSPLSLVLWIDNQYAAFPPSGRLAYGTLADQQAGWLELQDLRLDV